MGDALDIEQPAALVEYLRRTGRLRPDELPEIRVLRGGVSNRTVWLGRPCGEAWVLKQALAKLRVSVDWFSDPRRIEREALGLRWLESLTPPGATTPLVFVDPEVHVLAMQAVPEPHDNFKTLLLAGKLAGPMLADAVGQFARLLAAVHREAWRRRDELADVFAERGFFQTLRVEPYYTYSADQAPEARPFLLDLIRDTEARRLTLVHGDYSPKNVLIHAGRLVLLDHEVIHWGDPAFDLGFSLTHLLSKAHHLPAQRRELADQAVTYWLTYFRNLGDVPWRDDLEAMAIRHTLACLLARVVGRSPLEYLTDAERHRQRQCVVALVREQPLTVRDLVSRFLAEVAREGGQS